jgi:orotidine-5'-phosphate decarboxylase
MIDDAQYKSFLTYFRVYGAPEVLATYRSAIDANTMTQSFFMPTRRSVVPACDFDDLKLFEELVKATADVEKVGGYKVGSLLVKRNSLGKVVETAKKHASSKKVIHDYQKCGSDIAEMVYKQVAQDAELGCDATIVFPMQGGPEALLAAIHAGYEHGIKVIVGAEMTHQGFLRSEGGCVGEEDADKYYRIAAAKGIRNFVMPGTKPDRMQHYRELLVREGVEPVTVFSPGLVTQGGNISAGGRAAGKNYHAIVGRAIYEKLPGVYRSADDMRREAVKLAEKL